MFKAKAASGSFSVKDQAQAKKFYSEVLGLAVDDSKMGLNLHLPGTGNVFVYAKENHEPATFTVLNFMVDDIDDAVDELKKLGVKFERYEGFNQDENDIARGKSQNMGPDIAWFKDPAENIFAVIES